MLERESKKKIVLFMTVKCSLEQIHCSFQEDVAIAGNTFFMGLCVKTGGEEVRHCSSRCKY